MLRLIASGKSNAEVARTLVIALSTVKTHTNSIFGKLQVTSRTQAIALRARPATALAPTPPEPKSTNHPPTIPPLVGCGSTPASAMLCLWLIHVTPKL